MVDITVGVSLNNLASHYGLSDLIKAAQRAEELGFDAVWFHDAPLGRRTVAAWDPISVITAVGRETERVKLATGIFQPHIRNPVAVAQAWATADYLSGGRTIMGVGTGAGKSRLVDREYQAFAALRPGGETPSPTDLYKRRRRLFLESVHVIRRLWDEDHVTHHGEFFHLDEVTLGLAKPLQKPHPPIIIGAGHYIPEVVGGSVHHIWAPERAGKWLPGPLDRVGELGDGWITVQVTPEEYADARDQVLAHRGDNASNFTLAFNCFVNVNEDASVGLDEIGKHLNDFHGPPVPRDLVERWGVSGSAERITNRLAEYVEQGVTLFQLVIGSPDEFGQMARLATEMLPALRQRAATVSARR